MVAWSPLRPKDDGDMSHHHIPGYSFKTFLNPYSFAGRCYLFTKLCFLDDKMNKIYEMKGGKNFYAFLYIKVEGKNFLLMVPAQSMPGTSQFTS